MAGHRTLDLLGEDLLPAGIDGHRVAAEQFDTDRRPGSRRGRRGSTSARRRWSGRCARSSRRHPGTPVGRSPGAPASPRRRRVRSTGSDRPTDGGVVLRGEVAAWTRRPWWPMVVICMPVSEAPTASSTIRFGSAASSRSRTVGDSGAPPLVMVPAGRTGRSRRSRSRRASGRAIASPTTGMLSTRSRSASRSTAAALRCSTSSGSAIQPPVLMMLKARPLRRAVHQWRDHQHRPEAGVGARLLRRGRRRTQVDLSAPNGRPPIADMKMSC